MKVRLKTSISSSEGWCALPGEVLDRPNQEAKRLLETEQADPADAGSAAYARGLEAKAKRAGARAKAARERAARVPSESADRESVEKAVRARVENAGGGE